jgi:hypothetical protein
MVAARGLFAKIPNVVSQRKKFSCTTVLNHETKRIC